MCGIAGIAVVGGDLRADAVPTAAAMADLQAHRGPDGFGSWNDSSVVLAHRRLAIIDLTTAADQPMHSPSGRYVIVFNGEIYNFRELGARLRSEGWHSRGHGDTEVMLASIERWGLDRFLECADGQFAFALYDRAERRLVLARDRFGEKPLVYSRCGDTVYFASEMRAFDAIPGLDRSLDAEATASFFRFGHVPGEATIFRTVQRVPPASIVVLDLVGHVEPLVRTYWTVPRHRASSPVTADHHDQLRHILSESVRNRLVTDRPIGAFLSGGIDSSLVCAIAAEHTPGALKTFTMGWADAEFDESRQAQLVADALGADHHDVRLSRSEVLAAVNRLGSVMDEPFADSSQLAVLLVAEAARKDVVVALSGDGGDELFAGYNRHRWLLSTRFMRTHVGTGPRRVFAGAATRLAPMVDQLVRPVPMTRRPRLIADKLQKLGMVVAASSMIDAYQVLISSEQRVGQPRRLPPDVESALVSADIDEVLWGLRAADLSGYLGDDILTKVDRATMAVSLEARTPFLHPGLVELAMSMRHEDLIQRSGGKQPLRALLGELVPNVRFDQSKMGFGVPIADFLRHELSSTLADAIATHVSRTPPVVLPWTALAERLRGGDDRPAATLWCLLMFELWAAQQNFTVSWN